MIDSIAIFLNTWAPVIYGAGVAFTAIMAYESRKYTLCSTGILLLFGWLVTTHRPFMTQDAHANLFQDIVMLAWVWYIYQNRLSYEGTKTLKRIAGIFALMVCLHVMQLVFNVSDYIYCAVYNILFIAQLTLLIRTSTHYVVKDNQGRQHTQRGTKWKITLNVLHG